jgi:hypothetical protein
MHIVFANKAHRKLLVDWHGVASTSLAMFRADSAQYAGDPDFERLISTLKRISPEFRALWPRQDVLRSLSSHKRIKHPLAGRMTFEYTSFAVTAQADMKLIVYTPLDRDQTVEKLDSLLGGVPDHHRHALANGGESRDAEPSERVIHVSGDPASDDHALATPGARPPRKRW